MKKWINTIHMEIEWNEKREKVNYLILLLSYEFTADAITYNT